MTLVRSLAEPIVLLLVVTLIALVVYRLIANQRSVSRRDLPPIETRLAWIRRRSTPCRFVGRGFLLSSRRGPSLRPPETNDSVAALQGGFNYHAVRAVSSTRFKAS